MEKTAEVPLNVPASRGALGVSNKHRLWIVALLLICNVLAEVALLQPYLLELQKAAELSNSNSLFLWFLLYGMCGCCLGNQYGFLVITSVGLLLTVFWAVSKGLEYSDCDLIMKPNLRTLGAALTFSNCKFAYDIFKSKSFGGYLYGGSYLIGLVLAIGATKVRDIPWIYVAFSTFCFAASLAVFFTVPNHRLLLKPPSVLKKSFGVLVLVFLQLFWEYFSLDEQDVAFYARGVGTAAAALGCVWWVAQ